MSDMYCPLCGKYHRSVAFCTNQNLQLIYTQKGTTTIDLDEMRAEIVKLRAREAKLREALESCIAWMVEHGCSHEYAVLKNARAALRSEPKLGGTV